MAQEKFDSEALFNAWVVYHDEELKSRFLGEERKEVILDLVESFKGHDVPYEEAKGFLRRVVMFMTTKDGRKGRGKYKGWSEAVENCYKKTLAEVYVLPNLTKYVTPVEEIDRDEAIVEWATKKFGNNQKVIDKSHEIGSSLNAQFLAEYFGSVV